MNILFVILVKLIIYLTKVYNLENTFDIAIGGAIMHNLAMELHDNGHIVTGSDDAILIRL